MAPARDQRSSARPSCEGIVLSASVLTAQDEEDEEDEEDKGYRGAHGNRNARRQLGSCGWDESPAVVPAGGSKNLWHSSGQSVNLWVNRCVHRGAQ